MDMKMKRFLRAITCVVLMTPAVRGQNGISVPVFASDVYSGILSPYGGTGFTVTGGNSIASAPVKFKLLRADPTLVVSPSSGTTPLQVVVAVNPHLASSSYAGLYKGQALVTFTTTDQSPPVTASVVFKLTLTEDPPAIRAVLNSASWRPLASPGALVSILGTALGPPVTTTFGSDGLYPKVIGNLTVTFNGIPAPLLYSSPTQINALVPYALAGQKSAQVVVSRFGQTSDPFTVPLADTSPAVFTASASGAGQGAILNYDYSANSAANPATKGLGVYIYATGMGVPDPLVEDGTVNLAYLPRVKTPPLSVTIGGKDAPVYLVGLTQFQPYGLVQVVVTVPTGIASGPQPLVLKVGDLDNASQNITIAVK